MIPTTGILILAIITLFSGVLCFENHVPVYVWNIDTDAVTNPLKSLNSEELVDKLSPALDRKLIAVFMQDELNVEDFKSNDLASIKSLGEMDNDGTFYAPSVTKTGRLPAVLEAAGFRTTHVKSHKDLPVTQVLEKTVLVIELPTTQLGDSRGENLQLNANAISEVYEVLKSQQPDVVGIFTAKKNSKMDESRRRITRNAPEKAGFKEKATLKEDPAYVDKLINVTQATGQLFLFWESAPVLKIKDENKTEWGNFTLNQDPDTTGTILNETGHTALLHLSYTGLTGSSSDSILNKATFKFNFATKQGYWYVKELTVSYDVKIQDKTFKENDVVLTVNDISTPLGFSWHCTPYTRLATFGYTYNASAVYTNKIIFETNGFQLQPLKIHNQKFGQGYDCTGFFTEGIWAAIILGLIIAMMLAWAVSMLADVRTPDRYDDPKGKTITITATD